MMVKAYFIFKLQSMKEEREKGLRFQIKYYKNNFKKDSINSPKMQQLHLKQA